MARWRLCIPVAAAALAIAGQTAAQSASRAHLSLADRSPLTIRGTGFHRHERVRVVAHAGGTFTRRVTASRSGGFTVSFTSQSAPPCGPLSISARGSLGSRALTHIKQPEC